MRNNNPDRMSAKKLINNRNKSDVAKLDELVYFVGYKIILIRS